MHINVVHTYPQSNERVIYRRPSTGHPSTSRLITLDWVQHASLDKQDLAPCHTHAVSDSTHASLYGRLTQPCYDLWTANSRPPITVDRATQTCVVGPCEMRWSAPNSHVEKAAHRAVDARQLACCLFRPPPHTRHHIHNHIRYLYCSTFQFASQVLQ